MLGFRSLLRTHDTPELLDVVTTELAAWLRHKRYDPALLTGEQPAEIAERVLGSVQHHTDDVGSRALRARIVEHTPGGTWTSELTALNSPDGNRGWVWLDIHKPDDHGWTSTPRLARRLVATLPARDGAHLVPTHPRVVQEHEVERVVAAITDPHRRGLAFVAGTGYPTALADWQERVGDLLGDTVGISSAWVLAPAATERFHYLMQPGHGVSPGAIRTYLPGVVPGHPLDADRHRFLSRAGLDRAPSRDVRRLLGQRARDQMIAGRLPDVLRDLDRILRRRIDSELLEQLEPVHVAEPVAPPLPPAPLLPSAPPRPSPDPTPPASRPAPVPRITVGAVPDLAALLRSVLGADDVTAETVARVEALARAGLRTEGARDRIGARLTELQESLEEADLDRELAVEELAIERRERADAEEERAEAERRLREVRLRLSAIGRAEAAWTEPEVDVRDVRPDTFVELMSRLGELPRVSFTGDTATTLDLDKHGLRSWSGKAWDALLALDDYARVSATAGFSGDVAGYLADTPAGCRGFSGRRHAFTESEEVHNAPRLRRPRMLPVPETVHETGRIFMGAHFKIAQSARVSPRLHYLDDTARSGLVYVGHLGPHLPLSTS